MAAASGGGGLRFSSLHSLTWLVGVTATLISPVADIVLVAGVCPVHVARKGAGGGPGGGGGGGGGESTVSFVSFKISPSFLYKLSQIRTRMLSARSSGSFFW